MASALKQLMSRGPIHHMARGCCAGCRTTASSGDLDGLQGLLSHHSVCERTGVYMYAQAVHSTTLHYSALLAPAYGATSIC